MRNMLLFAVLAVVVNVAAALMFGFSKPMASDSFYFLQIAQSLASGDGYVLKEGFRPDEPTTTRAPGWPLVIAAALKVTGRGPEVGSQRSEVVRLRTAAQNFRLRKETSPRQDGVISAALREDGGRNHRLSPDAVMRIVCVLLNALNACLLAMFGRRLTGNGMAGIISGALYLFYPTALYLACTGASEILFITLVLGGAWCMAHPPSQTWFGVTSGAKRIAQSVEQSTVNSRQSTVLLGFLLLGYAAIVRVNFVIWIVAFGLVAIWRSRKRNLQEVRKAREEKSSFLALRAMRYALCSMLFLAPASLWTYRNYRVSGAFPVLSSLRGSVFYGGNNQIVSRAGPLWGYWIFADEIPGEKPMREMAATMSELEIDRYYFGKGIEYLTGHWKRIPFMVAGKLVRAYVPVPWKFSKGLLVINAYRFCMYALIIAGLYRCRRRILPGYGRMVFSFLLVNIVTVVVFWGCARFAFEIEPLFLPFAGMWLAGCKAHGAGQEEE